MDAIAIMGHISYDLAQRRRDVIRPTLNKKYATLCASHVPITTLLFGDELQAQLNHIRASNKIKNTASGSQYYPPRRHFSPQQAPARSGQQNPFYGNSRLRAANPNTGESTNNIGPINRGIRKINEQHFDRIAVYLENKVKMFKAGNLAAYVKEWQALTSDPEIMKTLTGQRIEFSEIPVQSKTLMNVKFTEAQTKLESITDVKWCRITSLTEAYNPINHGEVEVTISTDGSLTGWGACIDTTTTGGNWTPDERAKDINYLEILAVFLALQSFSPAVAGKHVKLLVDNTTAVFSINNMGTFHSKANNTLVAKIWEWSIINNTWLTVAHIPGKQNTAADRESRAS
ncbi:Enzymatic poly [Paramuricea clavata]|uniref:Enzymatic poly n=1 Tax=Paramuricea clavata TaxID=317549 RepID=A0A6S7JUQ0_PARCT|nr:Enzymatic poly [Paramuricea clavata]